MVITSLFNGIINVPLSIIAHGADLWAMLLAIQPPPTTLSRIRLRLKTLLAKIVLRSSGRRQYWIVLVNQHWCSKSASCDLWG